MSSGDGARIGVAQAVRAAADAAQSAPAEQLALLPPPTKFTDGTSRHRVVQELVRRGDRGRPAGAQNIATREMLAFVRQVIGDPVLERARWLRHTPASLARELGCTELEAFDRLDKIRSELTKLFYAPLAAVDGHGNAVVPQFAMVVGGAQQAGSGPSALPWDYIKTIEQNQPLSETPDTISHGDISHEDAK